MRAGSGPEPSHDALVARLREAEPSRFHVVSLPDYFLDHFVELPDHEAFARAVEGVHARGGGNLAGLPQRFAAGGNAANTAAALARLGVKSHLIAKTSVFGLAFLRDTFGRAGVDLSRVRDDGELSITTALEFAEKDGNRRNVMLSYGGTLATFGPSDLTANDVTLIEAADAVLLANWSQAVGQGTELARTVAALARKAGTLTYLDTGDPSHRSLPDVGRLVSEVLAAGDLGVLALNENELRQYAAAISGKSFGAGGSREEILPLARLLKMHVPAILDLHTASFAATWGTGSGAHATEVAAATFPVNVRRVTGAGDAWNAGNLLGHLLELPAHDRLVFANAVAGLFVSSVEPRHPSIRDVIEFLEKA